MLKDVDLNRHDAEKEEEEEEINLEIRKCQCLYLVLIDWHCVIRLCNMRMLATAQ